ncbi:MAG: 2-oxoglutarate and iron-dependent oxygenase domain-containing protein [Elainellaceae cyanobacterium]
MTLTQLPVINIAPYLAGTPEGKAEVARQINAACTEIGFFMITGHRFSRELLNAAYETASQFFNLPSAEKLKIKQPDPQISRGYTPLGGESLAYGLGNEAPPDLKEMVDFGPVDVLPDDSDRDYFYGPQAGNFFYPNLFPKQPPQFKAVFEQYYRSMNQLANALMQIFATALELPEGYFVNKLDKNLSAVRIIRYPEQNSHPQPGQLRSGAHTDYGTLTILYADQAAGGLQVKHRQGYWVDVMPVEGCFTVNIGDAMQIWTNDRWISTLHRVVNPPAAIASSSRRQSIVFFHQPNYDTVIEPLPCCIDDHHPQQYQPVTFGQHWMNKWMATKVSEVA